MCVAGVGHNAHIADHATHTIGRQYQITVGVQCQYLVAHNLNIAQYWASSKNLIKI